MGLEPTNLAVEPKVPLTLFSNSARIKHVPPQAGQLSIHFLNRKGNQ